MADPDPMRQRAPRTVIALPAAAALCAPAPAQLADPADRDEFTAMAKIGMATGEVLYCYEGRHPSIGATLTTAGRLVCNGDGNRRFRAFDDETGETLWERVVGGTISSSTISHAVNDRQYVAIPTGDNPILAQVAGLSGTSIVPGNNTIHVFALPDNTDS